MTKKPRHKPPYTDPPDRDPRRLAECYIPTTEHWGGSYFVCDNDPLGDRPQTSAPQMACLATLRHFPNLKPAPNCPPPPAYRLTLWGTDDTLRGRWFHTPEEALSCLAVLLRRQPVTFALCDELGLLYD